MCRVPFIDWNDDGQLDSRDIAITLTISNSEETADADEKQEDDS